MFIDNHNRDVFDLELAKVECTYANRKPIHDFLIDDKVIVALSVIIYDIIY